MPKLKHLCLRTTVLRLVCRVSKKFLKYANDQIPLIFARHYGDMNKLIFYRAEKRHDVTRGHLLGRTLPTMLNGSLCYHGELSGTSTFTNLCSAVFFDRRQ